MHKYGCLAYPRINNQPKLNRLNLRAEIGFLVGWQSLNIYHVWILSRNKVIFSRDVTFNEEGKWDSKREYNPISLHEDIDPIFIELPEKEAEGNDINELQRDYEEMDISSQTNRILLQPNDRNDQNQETNTRNDSEKCS
jgi:hypothetical protein